MRFHKLAYYFNYVHLSSLDQQDSRGFDEKFGYHVIKYQF